MIRMLKYVFLTKLKKTNIKVFNLMSRANETRHIKWYKTCKCRCRLGATICNNVLCPCSIEIEDTWHYLLHCHYFSHHRVDLMNSVKSVCDNFEVISDNVKKDLLLFSDSRFDENKTKFILEATRSYIRNFWKIL